MINLMSLKTKIEQGIEILRDARRTDYCKCGWCVCLLCVTTFSGGTRAHQKDCEYVGR